MKAINYLILTVIVTILATDFSSGQSYSITPNDTFEMTGYMEDLQTLTISQLNISSDTIVLGWKKVSDTVPLDWEASICDNRICYTVLMDSGTMNPIARTETGFLILHIVAHVNYGSAIVRYAVWDIQTPGLKDTVTFIMSTIGSSGITESVNKNVNSISPNPAKDNISVVFSDKREHNFAIYNLLGERIYSGVAFEKAQISTATFANGMYTFSLLDRDAKFTTSKILVHH